MKSASSFVGSRCAGMVVAAAGAVAGVGGVVGAAHGQVQAPAGFAVDTLLAGQPDGITPRIEAVRNPGYGSGVVAASIARDILTVRVIEQGNVRILGTTPVPAQTAVLDLRFDTVGLFGGVLFVSTVTGEGTASIYSVSAGGVITRVASLGSSADELGFTIDVTPPGSGFPSGLLLHDVDQVDGTALWVLTPSLALERLQTNLVPPNRVDVDIRGMEFDRTAAFGGRLVMADADANHSALGSLFGLDSSFAWSDVTPQVSTNTQYLRDLALSPGGELGTGAYVTEARRDVVARVGPDGAVTDFATGFAFPTGYDSDAEGAASLTIDQTGDVMYVADDAGVYRIRPAGNVPGPSVIAREPNSPDGVFVTPGGIASARLIWSEPVAFDPETDIEVRDAAGEPVGFSASGSGTGFTLLSFAEPALENTYTITVHDTARSAPAGPAIDGDNDGLAGGDYTFTVTHDPRPGCDADQDGDGDKDVQDLLAYLRAFRTGC